MRTPMHLATVSRIAQQLRHDRRTMAIVIVMPLVVLTLLHFIFDERQPQVSIIEANMLVIFPTLLMFLLTAIAMVRERTSGTLERLMTTPIHKLTILGGYGMAFGLLATVLACVATTYSLWVLGMEFTGPVWGLLLTAIVSAQMGVALGLLSAAVSRNEFQAVQMMPVLLVPQLLLCGLLGPRDQMPDWLHVLSSFMPLSYGVDAAQQVLTETDLGGEYWAPMAIVAACVVVMLIVASTTLQRRTP